MKSYIQNGSGHELHLPQIGLILQPGAAAVVADSPAVVARKLGSLASTLHIRELPDSYAAAVPVGAAILANAVVDGTGALQASLSGGVSAAVRNSAGTYSITLSVAPTHYGSPDLMLQANALASPTDWNSPPAATASAFFIDSTHVGVSTVSPSSGAPTDSAFRVTMLDFA